MKRFRSLVVLGLVLACTAVVVPDSSLRVPSIALVRTDTVRGVDHPRDVIWILCLGSDARPGDMPLRTRADAIQMVGINLSTGTGADIGVPRDSWVDIPGHGYNRINAALYYGGPQLMGRTVGNLVGVQPDYVFTTDFWGFRQMINTIGGVTVHSDFNFSDPVMPGGYKRGPNKVNGFQALIFARVRHAFARGDFDRSANQQDMMRAILRQVRSRQERPGFMERGVWAVVRHMNTNLRPSELYRLAQAGAQLDPRKMRGCVITGGVGYAGAASVVFPNVGQARRIGDDVRRDATLDHGC